MYWTFCELQLRKVLDGAYPEQEDRYFFGSMPMGSHEATGTSSLL